MNEEVMALLTRLVVAVERIGNESEEITFATRSISDSVDALSGEIEAMRKRGLTVFDGGN